MTSGGKYGSAVICCRAEIVITRPLVHSECRVLTDYPNLQNVVPNLVVNEVLELYPGVPVDSITFDRSAPEEVQCKQVADQ